MGVMEPFLTWLWQGSALALFVAVALRLGPATAAATRYLLWWAVLATILTLPWAGMLPHLVEPSTGVLPVQSPLGATGAAAPALLTVSAPPVWLLTLGVAAWLGLVAVRLFALARSVVHLTQLRHRSRPIRPERERTLTRWMTLRDHGRRTCLRVSDDVVVPSLLGLSRPVVLLPRSLLDALSADELDHVVVHEYAHAQRWDDWTLLAQSVVGALVGLHPGIRLVTRALDRERELACDDWVIALGGCRRVYAMSVTKVAEGTLRGTAPTLAPGMGTSRGELTRRVARLLDPREATIRPSRMVLGVGVGMLVVATVLASALPPLLAATRPYDVDAQSRPVVHPPHRALAPSGSVSPTMVTASRLPDRGNPVGVLHRPGATAVPGDTPPEQPAARRRLDDPSPQRPPTPRGTSIDPPALEARAHTVAPIALVARIAPSRPPAPILPSRPTAQLQMVGLIEVPGPVPAPSRWQRVAGGGKAVGNTVADGGKAVGSTVVDGGRAVGRKVAGAGKATAGAVTRFGSAFARALRGGP